MTKGLTNYLMKNPFWVYREGAGAIFATPYFVLRTSYLNQDVVDDLETDVWYRVEGSPVYSTGRIFEDFMKMPVSDMETLTDTDITMTVVAGDAAVFLTPDGRNILVSKKLLKLVTENAEYTQVLYLTEKRCVFFVDDDCRINGLVLPIRSDSVRYKVVRQYDDSRLD